MKKEIVVHVIGTIKQKGEEEDTIEVYTTGTYYEKEGCLYLLYEEDMGEPYGIVKNTVKIKEEPLQITVSKKGITNSRMIFEVGQKNQSYYQTPFGGMSLSTNTKDVIVEMDEKALKVNIDYEIEVDFEVLSQNKIMIEGNFR